MESGTSRTRLFHWPEATTTTVPQGEPSRSAVHRVDPKVDPSGKFSNKTKGGVGTGILINSNFQTSSLFLEKKTQAFLEINSSIFGFETQRTVSDQLHQAFFHCFFILPANGFPRFLSLGGEKILSLEGKSFCLG